MRSRSDDVTELNKHAYKEFRLLRNSMIHYVADALFASLMLVADSSFVKHERSKIIRSYMLRTDIIDDDDLKKIYRRTHEMLSRELKHHER